jgi:MinD-like ATPase involved in chromosome partitioning or flagellar assembly
MTYPPDLPDGLPDLRRREPPPVVPWSYRIQRRWKELTRPGQLEAEHDWQMAAAMAALSAGTEQVAVISPKGGVGKTRLTLALGLVLAEVPLARPVYVELNPDWGNARQLLPRANQATVVNLLDAYAAIERTGIGLLQSYITMWSRLPVLTVPIDPDQAAALGAADYERVLQLLGQYYNVILLDCGTGYADSLTQFGIQRADHLVLLSSPDHGTVRTALESARYLASARYERTFAGRLAALAAGAADIRARQLAAVTLVVNQHGRPGAGIPADLGKVRRAASALNAVLTVPHSATLATLFDDQTLTLENLPRPVRRALKALWVAVLDRLVAQQRDAGAVAASAPAAQEGS